MLKLLARPRYGLLLGVLLGLVYAGTRRSLCEAQATLYFPPPLVLQQSVPREAPSAVPLETLDSPDLPRSESTAWAQATLTSKEAVDAVCKRIERSDIEYKVQALRSAVLLAEDKRVRVETMPEACVRLKVYAEDSRVCLFLCDSLLAYLTFKTKIPLEDPDPEKLVTSERQLRVQEKALSQSLWSLLAFDSPGSQDPAALQAVGLDLQDYQQLVTRYKQALRDQFFRETRLAASGPNFAVLEPPSQIRNHRPWIESALLGGILGIGLSVIATVLQPRRSTVRENVRWRIQEPRGQRRTAPTDSATEPDRSKDE